MTNGTDAEEAPPDVTPSRLCAEPGAYMRRREFITLVGGAAATWPLAVRAQQQVRVRRIGALLAAKEGDREGDQAVTAAFVRGLQKFGWTAGTNVMIDYRWGGGDADRIRL